jgi:hypothetical protein
VSAQFGGDGSVRLDADNEVQPDALLRIDEACGGQSRVAADGFIEGAPELVVEISGSSASYDLHAKLHVYRRAGVCEYIVWRVYDRALDWFMLEEGRFVAQTPDADGVLHSQSFPGLRRACRGDPGRQIGRGAGGGAAGRADAGARGIRGAASGQYKSWVSVATIEIFRFPDN